MAWVESKV